VKTSELRDLSPAELEARLDDARETCFKLRFQFSTGRLTDHSRLKLARRDVARLATILREKQLMAEIQGGES